MHGVKRVRQSQAALEAKKHKEQAKLKEYLALTSDVLARKKRNEYTKDAFDETQRLLHMNPEFYTVWNYRRHILLRGLFPASSPAEINDLLTADLSMTTAALKAHPKVYAIWNHRRWCLEHVPDGPGDAEPNEWKQAYWERELFVVEKMLDADARNFHAWNYRRYVLASMPKQRPPASELAYTSRKIYSNFSNFSAWHQRSKVLAMMWANGDLDETKSKREEFELVRNAMYTDPGDQSVWIYHRWLIGEGEDVERVQDEITVIQELLDEQPDSKWCMDSLVHYKRLLLRHHSPTVNAERLRDDCRKLLAQLNELDPARKMRYEELASEL